MKQRVQSEIVSLLWVSESNTSRRFIIYCCQLHIWFGNSWVEKSWVLNVIPLYRTHMVLICSFHLSLHLCIPCFLSVPVDLVQESRQQLTRNRLFTVSNEHKPPTTVISHIIIPWMPWQYSFDYFWKIFHFIPVHN